MCLDRSCSILECNLQYSSKETSFTLLEPVSANMDAGTLTEFVAGLYNEYYVFLSIGNYPKVSDALRSYMSSIWERVLCSSSMDCTCLNILLVNPFTILDRGRWMLNYLRAKGCGCIVRLPDATADLYAAAHLKMKTISFKFIPG